MTFEDARALALELLQEKRHLLNTHLLRVVGCDELLMREVRESLIFDDLAIDKNGVGLLAAPELADQSRLTPPHPAAADPSQFAPPGGADQRSTAKLADRGDWDRGEFVAINAPVATELKSLWTVAGNGNRQHPAPEDADKPTIHPPTVEHSASKLKLDAGPPAVNQPRYYFWNAGRESGPYPRQELEKLLSEGHLKPLDFVKAEGNDEWIPVSEAIKQTGIPAARRWGRVPSSPIVEKDVAWDEAPLPSSDKCAECSIVPSNASVPDESTVGVEKPVASTRNEPTSTTAPARPVSTTTTRTRPPPRSFTEVQSSPLVAWWKKGEQRLGAGRVRGGLAVSLLVAGACIYMTWPPAPDTIYESFMRCRVEMDGLQDKHSSPAEWQRFTSAQRPRMERLVATLRNRASAGRPADQELLWAGERCLLPILQSSVGSAGQLNQLFSTHMRNARRILDGEQAVEIAAAGSAPNASGTGPPLMYSALPPGVQSAAGQISGNPTAGSGDNSKQGTPRGN